MWPNVVTSTEEIFNGKLNVLCSVINVLSADKILVRE